MSDTVYRAPSGNCTNRIHRDPECYRFETHDSTPVEKPADAFPSWYPRCPDCFEGGDSRHD